MTWIGVLPDTHMLHTRRPLMGGCVVPIGRPQPS